MKIGIVGNGVVGHATARCYMEDHEVRIYDSVKAKSTHDLTSTLESDIIFVCLPTPGKGVGFPIKEVGCDLLYINGFFQNQVADRFKKANFVLKSTVPVGTCDKLLSDYGLMNLVHSPEFLTQRYAVTDAQCPSQLIIGFPDEPSAAEWPIYDSSIEHPIYRLYVSRFHGVPIRVMSSNQSEMVKLGLNSLFGVKLAFLNELNLLCERLGIDWQPVIEGMLGDGRISHSHTKVPGPDGQYGFGGSCLPKDLYMLATQIEMNETLDAPNSLIRTAWGRNHFDRKREVI